MKKITGAQLRAAVERAGLPPGTWEKIEAALATEPESAAAIEAEHISYYLGALLIIGDMGWFVTSAWGRLSGPAIAGIAIAYALLFGAVGLRLFHSASTRMPGGLLVTVAVCMTAAGGVRYRTCPGVVAGDGSRFLYALPSPDPWKLGRDGDRHRDCLCGG